MIDIIVWISKKEPEENMQQMWFWRSSTDVCEVCLGKSIADR